MKQFTLAVLTVIFALSSAQAQDKPVLTAPVGLQLYSLREQFKKDGVEKTLDKVKALGFQYVELAGTYGLSAEKFSALLKERGLIAVAGHFGFDRYQKEPEVVAKEAKALGLQYAGCAWIGHKAPFDEKQCRAAAEVFNKAGKALAEQGIKFYYHNHGYEFQPLGSGTLLDLLMEQTDPKTVFYQMDILWTVFPGADPVKLLEKYPDRWVMTHLKDLKKGVKGNLSGGTPTTNDVALGSGQMDFPAIFRATAKTGVKYHFIEDESPTVEQQLPESLKYLEQFKK